MRTCVSSVTRSYRLTRSCLLESSKSFPNWSSKYGRRRICGRTRWARCSTTSGPVCRSSSSWTQRPNRRPCSGPAHGKKRSKRTRHCTNPRRSARFRGAGRPILRRVTAELPGFTPPARSRRFLVVADEDAPVGERRVAPDHLAAERRRRSAPASFARLTSSYPFGRQLRDDQVARLARTGSTGRRSSQRTPCRSRRP